MANYVLYKIWFFIFFLIRQKEGKHLNRWWHVLRKSLKSNSLNIKLYNSLPVKNRHIFHNYKHWTKNIVNASTSVTCVFQKSIRMNTIRDYNAINVRELLSPSPELRNFLDIVFHTNWTPGSLISRCSSSV